MWGPPVIQVVRGVIIASCHRMIQTGALENQYILGKINIYLGKPIFILGKNIYTLENKI